MGIKKNVFSVLGGLGEGEEMRNKALELLNEDCPKDSCEWCKGR